ncbi:tetratricopeptide repeat protein [Paraflavisolibacter sp. H34]|uniref:tetratricopeptide repeat protein n=1 Tax=Huijunlia imazamoxiresistens TaxID=3127457 RepID=UPI00301A70DB
MKRPQWITAALALVAVLGLYAATSRQIFSSKQQPPAQAEAGGHAHSHEGHEDAELSVDTLLARAKETLTPEQASRLNFLEKSITRGDVASQQLHVYHQLAGFWRDSARMFEPYAWYAGQAARLENSEKSLTFAAHLFLDNLRVEENPELKHWKALQARDLFERSLKVNPGNDSSEVGLGAVYLYGGIESPMTGIQRIRTVVEKHPDNVYAHMTLGHASVLSGQLDKAVERFSRVVELQPSSLEAVISLAEVYERKGENANAIAWYKKSLPLVPVEGLKKEVEKRIAELSKK